MNKCRNVTAKARNVDQIVACSRRASSLTLMVGTSTAYPPFTGVIAAPLQEFPPARSPAGRYRRNRVPHSAGSHERWSQKLLPDRLRRFRRHGSIDLPSGNAMVQLRQEASRHDLLFGLDL